MTTTMRQALFVGCYAAADEPGIHAFEFDTSTGGLISRRSFSGVANPSFLALHPNNRWLFAASETGKASHGQRGAVWSFRLNRQTFELQPINQQSTRGDWPCHLKIDATGRWILASNYGTGEVAVFPILEDGQVGEMADFVQHRGQGPHPERQEGAHAHSATLSDDNRFVVVADLGIDQLVIYSFDAQSGKLSQNSVTRTRAGSGPRHVVFQQDGRRLYVANELDSTVTVYDYDQLNGLLSESQTIETLPPHAPHNIVADIHLASSGRRLYVSNRGHNSIAVFAIAGDGRLSRLAVKSCGGNWPRNFALSPDERFLLVGNENSDDISVLPILAGSTELGAPVSQTAVSRPACLQFIVD